MTVGPIDYIKTSIAANIEHAVVDVRSADGVHFELKVTAPIFSDLSMLAQHRLVYTALGRDWADKIHAIALTTQATTQGESHE